MSLDLRIHGVETQEYGNSLGRDTSGKDSASSGKCQVGRDREQRGTLKRHAGEGVFEREKEPAEQEPWDSRGQTLPVIHCTEPGPSRRSSCAESDGSGTQRASRQLENVDKGTGPCVVAMALIPAPGKQQQVSLR